MEPIKDSKTNFVKTLVKLFDENKLSDFDINFLQSWLKKKYKGQYARADQQARSLQQ